MKAHYKALARLSLLLLFVLIGACKGGDVASFGASNSGLGLLNGGGGTPTTVSVQLSPASIGNGGFTTVTATVKDSAGVPVTNYTVSFSVISAVSGSLSPATGVTNMSGQATTTFTAATPAADNSRVTIQATVTVNSVAINGSAQLTIGAPPLVPASVVVSLGTTTSWIPNGGNTTVTATVRDATPTLISGATVTFSVTPNAAAGSFSPSTAATGACPGAFCGIASTTFTAATPAGDNSLQNITATAGSASHFAQLTIGTPSPPAPVSASITVSPLSINISNQATVSVTVLGAGGAPAFNTAVSLSITAGKSLASFSTSTLVSSVTVTTNASGIASTPIYSGPSSGPVTVQATVGSVTPASASFNITSSPNSMTLNVVSSNLIVGQTTNITADVRNVMNNPVDNNTPVDFVITSGTAGSLSAPSANTINGVASVTFTATSAGSVIVQATARGTTITQQAIIIVNAAQAGSLQYVSVSPASGVIPIGGGSAVLTFKVLDVNGKPLQGQNVTFQLAVAPLDATLNPNPAIGTTDANGLVTISVVPKNTAGPVRVVASATVQGTTTVLYASSGPLSIGGGVPSYKWFSLSVEKYNIEGLTCEGVTDTISVNMADRFGNYNILQGTAVSFQTYYGAINTSNITNSSGQTQSVFRSQNPRPLLDGQVRILVWTTGEETFTDVNGNGVYDPGIDTFNLTDDLPEPYIDVNHNGAHDSSEVYFNWPTTVPGATPAYNGPNGVWDGNIPIWNTVDIWMTGPPIVGATKSHIACCDPAVVSSCTLTTGNISIAAGKSTNCFIYGSDQNGNALIGGTKVSLTSDKTDATIKWSSGFETYIDHPVNGPEITGYNVTNSTTSTTDVIANLSATIDWSGKCGALKVIFPYAGTVTLKPSPPAAPTNVVATPGAAGSGTITLTWTNSTGAASYNVYRKTSAGVTTADTKTAGVSSGYQFLGTPATTYYFVVTAVNSGGESPISAEVSATAP